MAGQMAGGHYHLVPQFRQNLLRNLRVCPEQGVRREDRCSNIELVFIQLIEAVQMRGQPFDGIKELIALPAVNKVAFVLLYRGIRECSLKLPGGKFIVVEINPELGQILRMNGSAPAEENKEDEIFHSVPEPSGLTAPVLVLEFVLMALSLITLRP